MFRDRAGLLPGMVLVEPLFAVLQAQGRGRDGAHALIDVFRRRAGRKP